MPSPCRVCDHYLPVHVELSNQAGAAQHSRKAGHTEMVDDDPDGVATLTQELGDVDLVHADMFRWIGRWTTVGILAIHVQPVLGVGGDSEDRFRRFPHDDE